MNGQNGYNTFGLEDELYYPLGADQTDMMMGSLGAGSGTTDPIRSSGLYNLPTSMPQPMSSSSTLPGTVASAHPLSNSQSPYPPTHYLPQQSQPRSQSQQQHTSHTNLHSLNASLSPTNRNGSSNDMLGNYGESANGFSSSVSPMVGEEGYGIGYDDSFAYDDMGGVMIGDDTLGDGSFDPLNEVFNDPLNEGLMDPLDGQDYQDGFLDDTPSPKKSSDHAEKRKSFEGSGERDSMEPGENEPKKRGIYTH